MRRIFSWLASLYIRLIYHTGAWQVVGGDIPERFWSEGRPFILAFWHGRILMMPCCWDHEKTIYILISQHRDGQLSAGAVGHFGIKTVAGSSTRGGAQAFRTLVKALKNGDYVGIAPDGPRGPRMRAQSGIILLARLSGAPIVPATYAVSRRKLASSWDRFVIALPFSRGIYLWGVPIHVARDADDEALEMARLELEDSLNALTETADRRIGVEPVRPAEAAST